MTRVVALRRAATLLLTIGATGLVGCGGSSGPAVVPATCTSTYAPPVEAPITDPALHEISGIVAGRRAGGLYWMHNDSGDTARVFALDRAGTTRAIFALPGVTAIDWEDIAIGPGPDEWRPYLYLADIGDNAGARTDVTVYRVPEPDVDPATVTIGDLRGGAALRLRYPDGPHDAEALVVDPRTGDLVIITKSPTGGTQPAYRAAAPIDAARPTTLERYGAVRTAPGLAGAITGADLSRSGDRMILRTYGGVRVVARASDAPLEALLERSPGTRTCTAPTPPELQGEAIAFEENGQGFVSVSEALRPVLRRYAAR